MSKFIRAAGLCVVVLLTLTPGASSVASIQFRAVDLGSIGPDVIIAGLGKHGHIAAYGYEPDENAVRCWQYDGARWTSFGLGGQDCVATDINDAGIVVGYAQVPTGEYHPFLYANGVVSPLGTLDGTSAYALAINASGTVVGYSDIVGGLTHAFVYENGVMRDLDPQCALAVATDINDAGQITGYRSCDFGPNEAFRYQNGIFQSVTIANSTSVFGSFINASGDIAGFFYPEAENPRAFLFEAGVARDLGTVAAGDSVFPMALGDGGVVVGYSWSGGETVRAFASAGGGLVDLGALDPNNPSSQANSVNAAGQIVGWTVAEGRSTGFFSAGVGMQDLNALLTADSPHSIVDAWKINAAGEIAARAIIDGQIHIVLLRPVPSASRIALTAASSTYGSSVLLSATLTSNGAPLAEKAISFSVNGTGIGVATTDASGLATIAAGTTLPAGLHEAHASFAGDGQSTASDSTVTLVVTKAIPRVTVTGGTFAYDGRPHEATASASGAAGESLGPVIVTYNGGLSAPVNRGAYSVLASYAGNSNYEPGTAAALIEIINHAPTALCGDVVVVAAADGTATASVNRGSFDADGDAFKLLQIPAGPFGLGRTRVTLSATDSYGAQSSCEARVTVLRYGLRAAFGFEEAAGTGTALDSSPFHNNGKISGPERTIGRFGQGMRFDGLDDIIDVADNNSLDLTQGMTLMAWVRADDERGWRTILMKERRDGLAYALYANNDEASTGHPAAYVHTGAVDHEVAAQVSAISGNWMHIAVAFGGGKTSIYVNGALERTEWAAGSLPVSDRSLRIGGNTVWPDEFFRGVMDEVRIYDRPLSRTEIRDDMKAPVVFGSAAPLTAPAGLVAAYSFDDGTATDVSGRGHNGAVHGAVPAAGLHGKALAFDGIDDLVEIADAGDLDLTSSMTIEAWVYPTALGTDWRTAVLKSGASGLVYGLYVNDGGSRPAAYARIEDNDIDAPSLAATLPPNVWTHIAATYDKGAGRLALWVNGVKVGQHLVTDDIEVSDGALFIGGNTFWGEYFAGSIDGVRIYSRALDIVEIQTDMLTPP